jgi:hypothetical protein
MTNTFNCNSSEYSDHHPLNDSFIDYAVIFQGDQTWEELSHDDKVEYLNLLADEYEAEVFYRDRIDQYFDYDWYDTESM